MVTEQTDIDDVIDRILYDPPQTEQRLRDQLGDVTLAELRTGLVRRIERGELDDIDAIVAGNVFDAAGLGEARDRLVDIVASPMPDETDAHHQARQAAFISLAMNSDFDPNDPEHVFDLSPERYAELAAAVYSSLFEFTEMNLDLVYDFGQMLLSEPRNLRGPLFDQLESYRAETKVDAGVLYRPLLEDPEYREIWPMLLEAVAAEGVSRDATWLQRNADRLAADEDAQKFRKAAMELRTKGIESRERPTGFALVGTPDGAGAVPTFVFTERDDGIFAGHHLVFQVHDRAIRDGFFIPNIVREEIDDLVGEIEQSRATELSEVDLETGLAIIRDVLQERGDAIPNLPAETRLAAYRLERMPTSDASLPDVEPAAELDEELVREEFHQASCFESWFFDRRTLESAGALPLPEANQSAEDWKTETAAELATTDAVPERIAANLEFVARWYHMEGDAELAAQFAALADDARDGFESSLALELLLEHTLEAVREMQEYAGAFLFELLGNDELRRELESDHLEEQTLPSEERERYLDYMELAFRTVQEIRADVREPDEPATERLAALAGPIGALMAEFFSEDAIGPPDELAEGISEVLDDAKVDEQMVGLVIPELLTNGRLLKMTRY